jgi:hypothetical protein
VCAPESPRTVPASNDSAPPSATVQQPARRDSEAVPDEAVLAVIAADIEWVRQHRTVTWQTLSTDRAQALAEAAAPHIAAAEGERITGLFNAWIDLLVGEPNSHPPAVWKAAFADLVKIDGEGKS